MVSIVSKSAEHSRSGIRKALPAQGVCANAERKSHPLRIAYKLYLGNAKSRPSWDPVTLLYAARPKADYWKVTDRGYNHIFDNGTNQWEDEPDTNHILVQIPDSRTGDVTKILEQLITQPPGKPSR